MALISARLLKEPRGGVIRGADDIYPHRVGQLRFYHQLYIYFSAPDEATRHARVYLIQPDEVGLRAGKADFRIRAPNRGDD